MIGMRTANIKHKADKTMVARNRQQESVNQHNMLEIIDHNLPIEVINRRYQKVPIQGFCKVHILLLRRYRGESNNLFEGQYLDRCYYEDDVDVTHKEGEEEEGDHC